MTDPTQTPEQIALQVLNAWAAPQSFKLSYEQWAALEDGIVEALAAEREATRVLEDALNSVVARSHSWVIHEETAGVMKLIHDEYRQLAQGALERVAKMRESRKCINKETK